jgi:hypothetical protein
MRTKAILLSAAFALAVAGTAAAAQPLKVKPWTFDPDDTGIVTSEWVNAVGLPDAGKSNHALYLAKDGPTATNAAAGAEIPFEGELTELGFDYHNDSHCGAGAPRFNVYTSDPDLTYFFGCASGTHTPAPDDPENWTRVRFTAANAFPSDGVSFISDFSEIEVTGIDIVFDEGTDVGVGDALLDNIDVNGILIGKPGAAKKK